MSDPSQQAVGQPRRRREDRRLLRGDGEYVDDIAPPDGTHLAFVRSQYGHARIETVDLGRARAVEGVLAAYTWADLADSDAPGVIPAATDRFDAEVPGHPVLARDRVRYQGQPVAAVVAEDRYTARDAVEAVDVEYDRLDAVTDPAAASDDGAPTLFEAAPDNLALTHELGDSEATDRAFAEADHSVELDLVNNRLIPSAMEPRAAVARYDRREERLTVEMTSQSPHGHRSKLAETLGMAERNIRVRSPDVGGGFGHKGHHHPGEAAAAWAAMELDRPVKWTATRTENYLAGAHGRDHVTHAELAVGDDGTVRGLRAEADVGVGGYALGSAPLLAAGWGRLLAGQYRLDAVHCRTRAAFTNTAPVHSYRGAGRPEAIYVTERLVDRAADELGIDPVELRRRNLISPEAFPYETPAGATYDSGDYERAMDLALETVGYEDLRERQRAARDRGEHLGIGVAGYVESTAGGFESGVVRVDPSGGVTVLAGTHSHGQGHRTTYAQVVADVLGVDEDDIDVREGDTDAVPQGTGTFGSRSAVVGGNAVRESAREVADRARRLAAERLEADPEDVELADGECRVVGAPDRSVPFEAVAEDAYGWHRPGDADPGLEATTFYEPDGAAYTFGTHVAVVRVDPDTGDVGVERYLAVDDCGERINPLIVDGQVHGGVAQGVGQALYENAEYDGSGNLVTGSLQDYAVPDVGQMPSIETEATVTPSPTNPLGVKGIGEAGTIAAPPALVNAVVDALSPWGIEHLDMPLTAERVWRAVGDESQG